MKRLLRVILTPSCWIQNDEYSSEWDSEIRSLMASNMFRYVDGCTASIGGSIVWVENHPYASFVKVMDGFRRVRKRPSRATILEAMDKYNRDIEHQLASEVSDYRDPPCESCGKKWREHEGPIALCRRLQIVRQILGKLKRGKLSPREALKAIEEIVK